MVLHTTNSVLSLKKSCLKKAAKTILATARSGKQKGLNLVRLPFELSEELFEFSIGETCAEEVDRVLNFFLKVSFIYFMNCINERLLYKMLPFFWLA